jgi:hypothetical protein
MWTNFPVPLKVKQPFISFIQLQEGPGGHPRGIPSTSFIQLQEGPGGHPRDKKMKFNSRKVQVVIHVIKKMKLNNNNAFKRALKKSTSRIGLPNIKYRSVGTVGYFILGCWKEI